jgi:hypothetical protein
MTNIEQNQLVDKILAKIDNLEVKATYNYITKVPTCPSQHERGYIIGRYSAIEEIQEAVMEIMEETNPWWMVVRQPDGVCKAFETGEFPGIDNEVIRYRPEGYYTRVKAKGEEEAICKGVRLIRKFYLEEDKDHFCKDCKLSEFGEIYPYGRCFRMAVIPIPIVEATDTCPGWRMKDDNTR